jgi:hypothetical protein
MSSVGKWDDVYSSLSPEDNGGIIYGDGLTYLMAASFLADVDEVEDWGCGTGAYEVEDWGCGTGAFRDFCKTRYVGIDGSRTPFADFVCDLSLYRSKASGIVLRHVLEHNYNWETILRNAVDSFTKKLCLILFTPFADETLEIARGSRGTGHDVQFIWDSAKRRRIALRDDKIDVPDLSLPRETLESKLKGTSWVSFEDVKTDSPYGIEHVYLVWKTE